MIPLPDQLAAARDTLEKMVMLKEVSDEMLKDAPDVPIDLAALQAKPAVPPSIVQDTARQETLL